MAFKPSLFVKISAVVLTVLIVLPIILIIQKTGAEYAYLKDTKFQVEKLLSQNRAAQRTLNAAVKNDELLQSGLNPLVGTRVQSHAKLQARIRAIIASAGGVVDVFEEVKSKEVGKTAHIFTPISVNVRWNTNEVGLGNFLAALSGINQNITVDDFSAQRRQGTASIIDVRMTISSLSLRPGNAMKKRQE